MGRLTSSIPRLQEGEQIWRRGGSESSSGPIGLQMPVGLAHGDIQEGWTRVKGSVQGWVEMNICESHTHRDGG